MQFYSLEDPMREERDGRGSNSSRDLNNPKNPPQSLLRREVRRFALMSYLGPLVVLVVVVGIALIYWANRSQAPPQDVQDKEIESTGTSGFQPDGGGARPKFDTTADELKFKGSSLNAGAAQSGRAVTLTEIDRVAAAKTGGQRVSLPLVEVSDVENGSFWIHDGNNRVAVIAPDRVQVKDGQHVSVDGITEVDPSGGVRVRASHVEVH
jgi:hypothetical protein